MPVAVYAAAIVGAGVWVGDWIAGLAVAVLALAFEVLKPTIGPPVLFLAVAFQWMQVTIGLFYLAATGRSLVTVTSSDYRPMVLIGLGCVASLAVGLRLGMDAVRRQWSVRHIDSPIIGFNALLGVYVASFLATGVLQQIAWQYPLFTQAILAASFIRLGILYVLLRRVILPVVQWPWVAAILGFEVVMGFTGYFASFREPLILAAVAFAETFDPRRLRHWAFAAAVSAVLAGTALFWMGVRGDFRQDFAEVEMFAESRSLRLDRIRQLFGQWRRSLGDSQEVWWNLDFLVDRLWVVYYPALAVSRVPAVLPHTGGEIIGGALRHITTPRALFPDKPELPSDSEMVRRFSGVWVAGWESETSIAFGYAAEAYVDFGVPLMFVPVLLWAVFLGAAYQSLLTIIRHREIAIPLVAVIFWLSVYLFERSFVKWMGLTGTLLIYVGGIAFLLDRWLLQQYVLRRERQEPAPTTPQPAARASPVQDRR
jgi:hypothetical protein